MRREPLIGGQCHKKQFGLFHPVPAKFTANFLGIQINATPSKQYNRVSPVATPSCGEKQLWWLSLPPACIFAPERWHATVNSARVSRRGTFCPRNTGAVSRVPLLFPAVSWLGFHTAWRARRGRRPTTAPGGRGSRRRSSSTRRATSRTARRPKPERAPASEPVRVA